MKILNEQQLKEDIEIYKSMFPDTYTTFENLMDYLKTDYNNGYPGGLIGFEVSSEWEDKCYGFEYQGNQPDITYEYVGIVKC